MYMRIYRLIPQLLILGAFGPYLVLNFGLRTEQFIAYSLFILFLPKIVSPHKLSVRLHKTTASIALLWGSITVFVLLATFITYGSYLLTFKKILAGLDNQLMCLCILLTVGGWQFNQINTKDTTPLRDNLCKCALLVGYLLLANTLLAVSQAMSLNVNDFLAHFWSSSMSTEYGKSVASRVLRGGSRFTGIFNQPFECGLLYSIGLLLCAYRYMTLKTMGLRSFLVFASIIVGGIIGGSKVFILGGIPFAAIYVLGRVKSAGFVKRCLFLGVVGMLVLFVLWNINEETWRGVRTLKVYLRMTADSAQDRSALELYSAGRFGGDRNYIKHAFEKIWDVSPVFGIGFGSARVVLDNAYIVMYKQGGFPALILYVGFIASLLHFSYKRPFIKSFPEEARFLRCLVILLVVAGLGAPTFTINRAGTIVWVLLGLILPYTCLKVPSYAAQSNTMCRPIRST